MGRHTGALASSSSTLLKTCSEYLNESSNVPRANRDGELLICPEDGFPELDGGQVFGAGRTRAENGSDFGLSIVRQFAEGHCREIAVPDEKHRGGKFDSRGAGFR